MELVTKPMNEYEPARIDWLWPGRIPRGKLTLLFGDPGLGKSYLTAYIAAMVSRGATYGARWADGAAINPLGCEVVMLSGEDDPHDTIRPRLENFGAHLDRVHFVEGVRSGDGWAGGDVELDRHIDVVARKLATLNRPRLVVVDPISAYMGDTDSHNNTQVRAVLKRLSELARTSGVAVVCVTHSSKNKAEGTRAVHRAMGSLAFAAAARIVWQVAKHPADPDKRTMLLVKSNLPPASKGPTGLVYQITPDGGLTWSAAAAEMEADDAESPDAEPEALSEAIEFLKATVGPDGTPAEQVIQAAERVGISVRTLRKAKRLAGVESHKSDLRNGPWAWRLSTPPK